MTAVAAGSVIALALLAACQPQGTSTDVTDGSYDSGAVPYDPTDGGSFDLTCHADRECGSGLVCARDGECLPASLVRAVHVRWTVRGAAPTAESCAAYAHMAVSFAAADAYDSVGFAPVPCPAGVFTVDKLPRRFRDASIRTEAGSDVAAGAFDATGAVLLDLP